MEPATAAVAALCWSLHAAILTLTAMGRRDACEMCLRRLGAMFLARVLGARGAFEEALSLALGVEKEAEAQGDRAAAVGSCLVHAAIVGAQGKIDRVEEVLASIGDEDISLFVQSGFAKLGMLAAARFCEGRHEEARSLADQGMEWARALRMRRDEELAALRLVRIEVLMAEGDLESAGQALAEAREILLARAEQVGDMDLRKSYLENIPVHHRLLELRVPRAAELVVGEDA